MSPHAPRRILLTLVVLLAASHPRSAGAQAVSTFATGLNAARSCTFDASGNLYTILRTPTSKIMKCTPPSNAMTQWASGFSDPIEMVFDDAGYAYVVDYTAGHVVKVSPDGLTKTTFATIANPASITRDAAGNLYVAEYFNQKIDKITPAGVVSTYVASIGGSGDRLTMLSMDANGTLYAGLLSPGTIYRIGPGGSPVAVFNNSMVSCLGFEKDAYGYWYSVSYDGDQVFRIRASDGVGAAIAGASAAAGHVDGTLAASRFNYPCRPVLRDNILYVPEYNNDDVRVIYLEPASPTKSPSWGAVQALYR